MVQKITGRVARKKQEFQVDRLFVLLFWIKPRVYAYFCTHSVENNVI